jgi:hypothetical protein
MVDKMRAQAPISTHAEVLAPLADSTRAVATGSGQELPHLVAQSQMARLSEKSVRASPSSDVTTDNSSHSAKTSRYLKISKEGYGIVRM